jgi:hypothetical protein
MNMDEMLGAIMAYSVPITVLAKLSTSPREQKEEKKTYEAEEK